MGVLVNSHGQVRAFPFDSDGQPAFTPDLIANVSNYLKNGRKSSAKMRRRLLEARVTTTTGNVRCSTSPAIDSDDVLNELRDAQTVVVVRSTSCTTYPSPRWLFNRTARTAIRLKFGGPCS